ncbi:site-specific DNA-methyltransferase [Streptomyces pseudogriseolus]|uniref:site-specific DNA-methyltransferase n=1 Tax=Streptomyces pseudogriseolus TaxID=36817 RepID=UPI003FA272B1
MSRLTDLIRQAKATDPQLGTDLEAEFRALTRQRNFGLVFEKHKPEVVELPQRPVRKGDKVRVLPPRGEVAAGDQRLWSVTKIERIDGVRRNAHLLLPNAQPEQRQVVNVEDCVVVAEFRDPIYPGLVETGRVGRGGDKPFHSVINAENFHALEMLTYTHRHKIDVIYIDPPYNSGARDWKYNNDYVGSDDDYRHSKWLSFMERRLNVAKELLNPDESVLIVTIDEKEYLRLGLLLEQVFPEGRITMVTSSISAGGASRAGTFSRSAEYLYFVQFGSSRPTPLPLTGEWNAVNTKNKEDIYWSRLLRAGTNALRSDRPNQFYPIYLRLTDEGPVFDSIGEPLLEGDPDDRATPAGCVAVWPIRKDGEYGRWQVSPEGMRDLVAAGCARIGNWKGATTTLYYLKRGERAKVENGIYPVTGHRVDGSVITDASEYQSTFVPTDVWRLTSHDAGNSGSRLIAHLIPGRKFNFPKSLYAVEDALRFFVKNKPRATILDFFAGSGTTAHAVMRLNREDDGRRQCILVTNNEVGADEQAALRRSGLRPGDTDWEKWGICDYLTKPRIEAAITGKTPEGEPIKGEYKFNEQFPMGEGLEENVVFYTLTYEAPLSVSHNRAFARIAPLLWIRAGSQGRVIEALPERGWDVAEAYGVLENLDRARDFVKAVSEEAGLRTVYIVTDDERRFQMICADLPSGVLPLRLYESYLTNFEINSGRGVA